MSSLGFPFAIVNGSVRMAQTANDIAQSQIAFAVGTQVAERVMRAGWGIDITNTIWAVGGDLEVAVPEAVGLVFTKNFPAYTLHSVTVGRDPLAPYNATVVVLFATADTPLAQSVSTQITLPTSDNQGATA